MPTATITQVLTYTPFGAAEQTTIKTVTFDYDTESTGTVTFKDTSESPGSITIPMEPQSSPMFIRLYNRGSVELAVLLSQGISSNIMPSLPPYTMFEYAQPADITADPITDIKVALTDDAAADCAVDYVILYKALPIGAPM